MADKNTDEVTAEELAHFERVVESAKRSIYDAGKSSPKSDNPELSNDIRVMDAFSEVNGAWRDMHYPGGEEQHEEQEKLVAQCDRFDKLLDLKVKTDMLDENRRDEFLIEKVGTDKKGCDEAKAKYEAFEVRVPELPDNIRGELANEFNRGVKDSVHR